MENEPKIDDVNNRLKLILQRFSEQSLRNIPPEVLHKKSLSELGLDSFGILSFLVAVEDELGIEWDDDLPSETFRSLDSISMYIADQFTGSPKSILPTQ